MAAPLQSAAQGQTDLVDTSALRSPVVIKAQTLTYDERLDIVTASGAVEIVQGPRILNADTVTYNRRDDVVSATGMVTLLESTGEVLFADHVEVTGDLRNGFIDNVRMLLSDDTRIAGTQGERRDGRETTLYRAVFSPCALCEDDPDRAPLWQIKAVRVIHDSDAKDVIYEDAQLEMFGVPVFYTPYFRHPDPTVERRTGFLTPRFGSTTNLGPFVRPSYYIDIAPDMDATLEAILARDGGGLAGAEVRKRFEHGSIIASGSLGTSNNESDAVDDSRPRGHIFATGRFDLGTHTRTGFDVAKASDDVYLDEFEYPAPDVLESRGFVEYFDGRDYADASVYAFQDTREDSVEQPLVLPLARYRAVGRPGETLGGRWDASVGVLDLERDNGTDTRRLSAEMGWEREFIGTSGLVTTTTVSVRGDLYSVSDRDLSTAPPRAQSNASTSRFFPVASIRTRYPLVRGSGAIQQLIEPSMALTIAPNLDDDPDIPNEDSQDIEFDIGNLFSVNRFPGVDRIEGGNRLTYGLRMGVFGASGGSSSVFVGQSYRFTDDDTFPDRSGLEDHYSDFVGEVRVDPGEFFEAHYRTRIDKDDFDSRQHELDLFAGTQRYNTTLSYIFAESTDDTNVTEDRQQIFLTGRAALDEFWRVEGSHRRNIGGGDSGSLTTSLGLVYEDECFAFSAVALRDLTEREGLSSGDSIFFRLSFKHLGEFTSPEITSGN